MNIVNGSRIKRKIGFHLNKINRRIALKNKIKVIGTLKHEIEIVYVINLDRQKKRWRKFQKEAYYQKIKETSTLLDYCHRISAIDGKEIKRNEFKSHHILKTYNLNDQYFVDPDPRLLSIIREKSINVDLTKEEIAVALSHIKIWHKILNENIQDDVFFEKDFAKRLNETWQDLATIKDGGYKFDLLYLSFKEVERGAEKEFVSKNLSRPKRGLWWLSGYVLSYSGAKKLLRELPINGPVDLWMNLKFNKLDVYTTQKSLISQRFDLKSENNYSILPILSQVGIQSDKTHLIFEQKKGKNPVFVIDFENNENEVEIIGNALSLLGYRCCINRWNEFSERIDELVVNNKPLLFDAYIGFNSIINKYKELDTLYPNAVFLLIYNDSSERLNSQNTYSSFLEMKSQHQEFYQKIKMEITEYFSKRKNKLLTINSKDFISWNKLCDFLNCSKPKFSFPENGNQFTNNALIDFDKSKKISIDFKRKKILQHDVNPWIIPMKNLHSYGIIYEERRKANLVGSYKKILEDLFYDFNNDYWNILENSFPSNQAQFTKNNFSFLEEKGFKITVMNEKLDYKKYTSASIFTKNMFKYGRFEVKMKPLKLDGIITAFFLHRNDPWQEIDLEFLGNDTTKILCNVYYNPGPSFAKYNYGNRGTPILIELGFDASLDYHEYAVEWEPHEIRWYVDKSLIHVRATWEPTPIPEYPMQLFINTWPTISEELAGPIDSSSLPKSSYFKSIKIYSWSNIPNENNRLFSEISEVKNELEK